MALDPSIILGYKSPQIMGGQERQANALKLQQLIMGNQEAQMKMDAAKTATEAAQKYRDFISKNPNATGEQLRSAGYVQEGYDNDKFQTEQQKAQAEISGKKFKTSQEKFTFHAQGLKAVAESPDPINAANQFIQQSVMFGTMAPEIAQQLTAQMQGKTPEQIKQASMAMFQQALSAKEQMDLRDMKNVDNGGTNQVIMTDKLAGTVTPVYSTNKTQTPDSIANNQRMTQEGALNRGVTMRGQDLTNQRALEKNGIDSANSGYSVKPIPAAALKMQNESLDALATTKSINADLGGVLNQMNTGKLNLGLVNKGIASVKNNLNMSDENSRNISSFNSTLEKLRNDSLRLNKGVQTEGDAQRAWNEIINNSNDQELVKERLQEVMKINERASLLHQNNVDTIRSNYNVAPMDYSKYQDQPAAIGGKQKASNQPAKTVVKTGTINGRKVVKYSDGTTAYVK